MNINDPSSLIGTIWERKETGNPFGPGKIIIKNAITNTKNVIWVQYSFLHNGKPHEIVWDSSLEVISRIYTMTSPFSKQETQKIKTTNAISQLKVLDD